MPPVGFGSRTRSRQPGPSLWNIAPVALIGKTFSRFVQDASGGAVGVKQPFFSQDDRTGFRRVNAPARLARRCSESVQVVKHRGGTRLPASRWRRSNRDRGVSIELTHRLLHHCRSRSRTRKCIHANVPPSRGIFHRKASEQSGSKPRCTCGFIGLLWELAEIIYGVPRGIRTPVTAVKGRCPGPLDDGDAGKIYRGAESWWSQSGSNRRPLQCHCSALPAELWPREEAREISACTPIRQLKPRAGSDPTESLSRHDEGRSLALAAGSRIPASASGIGHAGRSQLPLSVH